MYHGIINVYKEAGYTSFDVVAKLRGILKQKKIGHTGTLDPMATGVLPVCLGNGTKLCDMLTDRSKEYMCEMILGLSTDTEDITGKVLEKMNVTCTLNEVQGAILSFIGDYEQIPPMYSAIKVDGKKLYELAREGKVIERKPRNVSIHDIEIISINNISGLEIENIEGIDDLSLIKVSMRVACSKGTYIRSLCRDIGQKLGACGCMKSLVRSRVGAFTLTNALTIDEVEKLRDEDRVSEAVLSLEMALDEYDELYVLPEYKLKIDNGNPLTADAFKSEPILRDGVKYRIYNAEGLFNAVYRYDEGKRVFMPDKFFPVYGLE